MRESITIFSPATIANVGPGFDILGFAIDVPGDKMQVSFIRGKEHKIINSTDVKLPQDPAKNVATVAAMALLQHLGSDARFTFNFLGKIAPGSGIGSSAASSAGAVFAVNHLLGSPLSAEELVPFAMKGEEVASGSAHADNVAPGLMGGFILVRSYSPLDLVRLPSPESMYCTVVHPEIELDTESSRKILKVSVPLKTATIQSGNVAGLITGLFRSDFRLIRDSLHDVIAEPARSFLIPGFDRIREAASQAGALGSSISGSGPSVFSLCETREIAGRVALAKQSVLDEMNIKCSVFVSGVNTVGCRIVSRES
ncbi:MAG: homoserine kinase [Bacteroidales bacterium]|nr:homoserine kinase [Bacteroidales bacterium]